MKKPVQIELEELLDLRAKAVAHDDYLDAIKRIKVRGYSVSLDKESDVAFRRGYNAAITDLSREIVDAMLRRENEG